MGTYNENLRSTVIDSLLGLQLEQKNKKAEMEAALFTLYYAQAAVIVADDQLSTSKGSYEFQELLKTEALNINNLSGNLRTAANNQKDYTAQAVSNSAVCASNIQIALNAIVRLASELGSITNIINASDVDTELFGKTKEASEKINKTAANAEKIGQLAMESSAAIAEVSSNDIANESNIVNQSAASLLQVMTTNFETITATVAAKQATLQTTRVKEKIAEGAAVSSYNSYIASNQAYALNNRELNLNLNVTTQEETYTVSFNYYQSPFNLIKSQPDQTNHSGSFPVEKYYILLVKESKQLEFSMDSAKNSATNNAQHVLLPSNGEPNENGASITISITDMKDADGEPMKKGGRYVVFVYGIFMDEYKRKLNNDDDYLSAPSASFRLTHQLSCPEPGDIIMNGNKVELNVKMENKVEYRCLLLPDTINQVKGLLTERELNEMGNDADLVQRKQTAMQKEKPIKAISEETGPGFYFSLLIAQSVSEANYTTAQPAAPAMSSNYNMQATIHENTTDIFGSTLIPGRKYIPAVLTVSTEIENQDQYASSLSKYAETNSFEYVPANLKN